MDCGLRTRGKSPAVSWKPQPETSESGYGCAGVHNAFTSWEPAQKPPTHRYTVITCTYAYTQMCSHLLYTCVHRRPYRPCYSHFPYIYTQVHPGTQPTLAHTHTQICSHPSYTHTHRYTQVHNHPYKYRHTQGNIPVIPKRTCIRPRSETKLICPLAGMGELQGRGQLRDCVNCSPAAMPSLTLLWREVM